MTQTVFLSGSRSIKSLPRPVIKRLQRITDQNFRLVLGDAIGADTAFQAWLHQIGYTQVEIFTAGKHCRNNLGSWSQRSVDISSHGGRYTQRDRMLAAAADYGLALWDGSSRGTEDNIEYMKVLGKATLVYLEEDQCFFAAKPSRVVHVRNAPPEAVYIGRRNEGRFGNPFSVGYGNHTIRVASRTAAIAAFEQWLKGAQAWAHVEPERRQWILSHLPDLKDKDLACHCAPKPCHGDVLADMCRALAVSNG